MGTIQVLVERVLPLGILGLALVAVPALILSPSGLPRLSNLREERARVDEGVVRLTREIRQLRSEVARIKRDPAAVERVARDELGLVRETELVFHFSN